MKLFILSLLLVAVFAVDVEVDDPDVQVLKSADFQDFINKNEYVLVEFYAPWCGHCKKLAPEYAKAATALKEKGSPAILAKVDATQNQDLGKKYAAQGYPTLKWFKNGEPTEYDGGRSEYELVSWVSKKTLPVSKLITTQEELDDFIASSNRIVAFVQGTDVATWFKVAERFETLTFGHVTDASLFGDRNPGTIEIYNKGSLVSADSGANEALLALIHKTRIQQRPKVFSQHWDQWLTDSAFPLVETYSDAVMKRAQTKKRDLLIIYSPDLVANDAAKLVAESLKGKLIVAVTDDVSVVENYGASGKVKPTAVYVTYSKRNPTGAVWNEETEGTMDGDTLTAFVSGAVAGTYNSNINSEPIPTSNDGPVTVVVGKTIKSIIEQSSKDVFIEFYAPWCGHCKSLAPIWVELGESYKDDENVVIAKMDATANTVPSNFGVRGYPTLIFFSKGKQFPYNGDRTVEALKSFVESRRQKKVEKKEKKDL